jgi:hypothetical protein
MDESQRRLEIDNRTMKLIVGVIAISLAPLVDVLAPGLDSISASYWANGEWPRTIFVGFLFAIGAFLLSYNGHSKTEMRLSKVAAFAAVGIAMFPCGCGGHDQIFPGIHYVSAVVMFGILAIFCYFFLRRALSKDWIQAHSRAVIYAFSGLAIILAMVAMAFDAATGDSLSQRFRNFTFYAEATGLVAFGIAWLTASKVVPGIARVDERLQFHPFRAS